MLPSALMSPNIFSTVPLEPLVTDLTVRTRTGTDDDPRAEDGDLLQVLGRTLDALGGTP